MFTKASDQVPAPPLCPRCHLPINPNQRFNVEFCMPAHLLPPLSMTPADGTANQYCNSEGTSTSPLPPVQSENGHPSPPLESGNIDALPTSSLTRLSSPTPSVDDKERRLSGASTDYSAEFDRFSINTEFEAALRQTEAQYFPQETTQAPTPPPTSSPSTESSLDPSVSDEPPSLVPSASDEPSSSPVGRRWVVFRGRVPGVYMSLCVTHNFPLVFSRADNPPQCRCQQANRWLHRCVQVGV